MGTVPGCLFPSLHINFADLGAIFIFNSSVHRIPLKYYWFLKYHLFSLTGWFTSSWLALLGCPGLSQDTIAGAYALLPRYECGFKMPQVAFKAAEKFNQEA